MVIYLLVIYGMCVIVATQLTFQMGDDYYFQIPQGVKPCFGSFRQSKVNPERSLQVAPGFDNKIFGVNEKLFKDKNSARIAESVVNGITGAFHPKSSVNVGKAVKGIGNVKLPSKVALKNHFAKPSSVPYETIPMHEIGSVPKTTSVKPRLVDSILQPGVDARIKFGNLTNEVVGFDDQKVLSPRVDDLPKMALKMDSGIDMKSIIEKNLA